MKAPLRIHSIDPSVQTRNAVVYDEVVLPPTSSSVIPTEPNAAYVTTNCVSDYYHTHWLQNVAYVASAFIKDWIVHGF